MKVLLVAGLLCWFVMIASWFAFAAIEFTAGGQPTFATAQYTHPLKLKGQTRFFTREQAQIDSIAHALFLGAFVSGAIAWFFYNGIQKRRLEARKNASLDRTIAERDSGDRQRGR
jgi:hypothetical protein